MVEEFAFVLCHLHRDYYDGSLVLGHELLLLARNWCCRKRGRARGSCCTGPTPFDRLPMCTFETLEHAVRVADTIQLERLAWAVFDNIMGPDEAPPLSGLETYSQIVGRLAGKAYKGLHMCCLVRTSASFGAEVTRARPEGPDPKKLARLQRYSMMWDVRKEFTGSYSTLKEKHDGAGRDQSSAPAHPVDPNIQGMKWMKEHQHSYRDVQLDFWLLLRPLMDGGEESTCQLACRLLSIWHWSLAIDSPLPHILPCPHQWTSDIGYEESDEKDKWQLWIEAYMCALQCMAEASIGWRWITERGIRVPKITRVVEIFWMPLEWGCPEHDPAMLPARREDTLVQNLEGVRQGIVHKLDEVATRCTSSIAWDQFAFPQTDQEYWREEATSSSHGYKMPVAPWRISVVLFPGRVWFHLGDKWWQFRSGHGCTGNWGFKNSNITESIDLFVGEQL